MIWLCIRNFKKGPCAHFSDLMFCWASGHHGDPDIEIEALAASTNGVPSVSPPPLAGEREMASA